ncbi:hypothetical protein [Kineococcus sp. SYSU DK003]|uniref:hypothetical protein n=1 Tax=Kineococcus sp. SYSU DK003 TaxID=3383124 RepID=UPI003D7C5B84
MVVVVFVLFAVVVLVLGVVDHVRPGRRADRSARATPFWLEARRGGSGEGFGGDSSGSLGGGSWDGGGCGGADGGGGSC